MIFLIKPMHNYNHVQSYIYIQIIHYNEPKMKHTATYLMFHVYIYIYVCVIYLEHSYVCSVLHRVFHVHSIHCSHSKYPREQETLIHVHGQTPDQFICHCGWYRLNFTLRNENAAGNHGQSCITRFMDFHRKQKNKISRTQAHIL